MIEDARGNIDYDEEGAGAAIVFVPGSWGSIGSPALRKSLSAAML
jgi:hypothetical protein